MTPTLEGRLQTRLFLAITVGVLWTAIIAPFLPEPSGVTVTMSYVMAYASLLLMAVYGLVWEFLYQALQQWRWDKDWPSIFVLLTVINEAPVVWLLDHLFPVMSGPMAGMVGPSVANSGSLGPTSPYLTGFLIHIGTTWLFIWLFSQGPMRVIFPRWRFEGGLVVRPRLMDAPPPSGQPALHPVTTQAHANGTAPSAPILTSASVSTTELVEGITCGHGHFGYPGLRYCMVCGRVLLPLAGRHGQGRRPPLGTLIFEDGTTHVLDGDVRLARASGPGNLIASPRDQLPAASTVADVRLSGWQPVISSESHRIAIALPGGGSLQIAPGMSAWLAPGAEFTIVSHRIRYESPYQPADADLARPTPQFRPVATAGQPNPHPHELHPTANP
jgi:hypothetical protein